MQIDNYNLLIDKIKAVLENDNLSDFECIEEIVCLFEDEGLAIDYRHDFVYCILKKILV